MASTISAARAALFALLAAEKAFAGVQVTFGSPDAWPEQEVVSMLGVESPEEEPGVIGGPRPRDETFTIVVKIKVHDPGGDVETVDARGWALADGVREVVYANEKLSGALGLTGWARISSQTSDGAQLAGGGGSFIYLEVRVTCRSRIA